HPGEHRARLGLLALVVGELAVDALTHVTLLELIEIPAVGARAAPLQDVERAAQRLEPGPIEIVEERQRARQAPGGEGAACDFGGETVPCPFALLAAV